MTGTCAGCGQAVKRTPCCGKLVTRDRLDERCDASETGRHVLRTDG